MRDAHKPVPPHPKSRKDDRERLPLFKVGALMAAVMTAAAFAQNWDKYQNRDQREAFTPEACQTLSDLFETAAMKPGDKIEKAVKHEMKKACTETPPELPPIS